jgi:hypothetical protein
MVARRVSARFTVRSSRLLWSTGRGAAPAARTVAKSVLRAPGATRWLQRPR